MKYWSNQPQKHGQNHTIQHIDCSILFAEFNMSSQLVIFAGHVFIDPSFLSIFVYGPLQSFVVNGGSLNNRTAERRGEQNACPRLGFQIPCR